MRKISLALIPVLALAQVVSYAQVSPPAAVAPSDSTSALKDFPLMPRILDTRAIAPTAAQRAEIQAGTFDQNPANQCPTTPVCGTASAPITGASCPDVCYAPAGLGYTCNPWFGCSGPPGVRPHQTPSCPDGYSMLNVARSEVSYTWQAALPYQMVGSMADYNNRIAEGWVCRRMAGTQSNACHSPLASIGVGSVGEAYGVVWIVDSRNCRVAGSCWGGVSCGVAHSVQTYHSRVECRKPAGHYPERTAFGIDGENAFKSQPQNIICGRVKSEWMDAL